MSGIPTNTVASNGTGVVSDDQLNTYLQSDQTVVQLRAFVGRVGMGCMLQGVVSAGDGGAGLFYWSAGNYTDDGTSVIVPPAAAGQGAWLRAVIQVVGNKLLSLKSATAPATPATGTFYIYMDSSDNKLKAKGPSGTVTVLANP